jgi:uncharacterized protein with HEPN domain
MIWSLNMSKRVESVYLLDMLTYGRRVRERAGNRTREELLSDDPMRESVSFNLAVIGEAAAQVSAETQAAHPKIPWAKIISMRNRLIHGYDRIDFEKVWEAVTTGVPALIAALEEILPVK